MLGFVLKMLGFAAGQAVKSSKKDWDEAEEVRFKQMVDEEGPGDWIFC